MACSCAHIGGTLAVANQPASSAANPEEISELLESLKKGERLDAHDLMDCTRTIRDIARYPAEYKSQIEQMHEILKEKHGFDFKKHPFEHYFTTIEDFFQYSQN